MLNYELGHWRPLTQDLAFIIRNSELYELLARAVGGGYAVRAGQRGSLRDRLSEIGHVLLVAVDLLRVLSDELLHLVVRVIVGELHGRALHEVRRGSLPRAADAVVERQLDAAHRVDHHARRVGRIPYFQLQFHVQRHIAEGRAFDADVAPLAVFQPGYVVARADVHVLLAQV